MPEHAHVLIWPTFENYDISAILNSFKQSVAKKALIFVKHFAPSFLTQMEDRQPNGSVSYRFWQRGGGYDRNVIEPRAIRMQIEYFHFNPVRRGLCEKAEDWLWSSAADYAKLRIGPIRIDFESMPTFVDR